MMIKVIQAIEVVFIRVERVIVYVGMRESKEEGGESKA